MGSNGDSGGKKGFGKIALVVIVVVAVVAVVILTSGTRSPSDSSEQAATQTGLAASNTLADWQQAQPDQRVSLTDEMLGELPANNVYGIDTSSFTDELMGCIDEMASEGGLEEISVRDAADGCLQFLTAR